MITQLLFHAFISLAFGKLGLWGPHQPIDPDNPINPWATGFITTLGGSITGFVANELLGPGQLAAAAIAAAAGAMLAIRAAAALGLVAKKL